MQKLRKMLGDINSQECISLQNLIETQSKVTLAAWSVNFAKNNYLLIYEAACPGDLRLRDVISACEEYLKGCKNQSEIKQVIKEAVQIARDAINNPAAQAAARAISAACAATSTPTNALGFIFYGAAATAYSQVGTSQSTEVYDNLALAELKRAFDSLQKVSVADESQPAKIKWGC